MEQQLTTQEICRVFGMYLGCDVFDLFDANKHSKLDSVSYFGDEPIRILHKLVKSRRFDEVQLLLTPLSAITDEHAIEVAKLQDWEVDITDKDDIRSIKAQVRISCSNQWVNYTAYQYLIQQHYAVPLFFGINHPCNGKDAIELGIAIDKTKINDTVK